MIRVIRKLGQIGFGAGGGKNSEFEAFWPSNNELPDKKVWGTKEEALALKEQIEKVHGIKLS